MTKSSPTHYELLGIPKDASTTEIKSAYRKKAKIHHPDISGTDGEKFIQIANAKTVLLDENKRLEYDNSLRTNSSPKTKTKPTPQPAEPRPHSQAPDPNDWVGSPQWSQPPSDEAKADHTHATSPPQAGSTQQPESTSINDPDTVIPATQFSPVLGITLVTYLTGVSAAVSPQLPNSISLPAIIVLLVVFLFAASTSIGFYLFPPAAILTPIIITIMTSNTLLSLPAIAGAAIPIIGFVVALLVTSSVK